MVPTWPSWVWNVQVNGWSPGTATSKSMVSSWPGARKSMPAPIGSGPSPSSNFRLWVISSAALTTVSRTFPGATVKVSGVKT